MTHSKIIIIFVLLLGCAFGGYSQKSAQKRAKKSSFVYKQKYVYMANVTDDSLLTIMVNSFEDARKEIPDFPWADMNIIDALIEYIEPTDTINGRDGSIEWTYLKKTVSDDDFVRMLRGESVSRDISITMTATQRPFSDAVIKYMGHYITFKNRTFRDDDYSELKYLRQVFKFRKTVFKYRQYSSLKFGHLILKKLIYKANGEIEVLPAEREWEGGQLY